ncbi:uncharacterized protein METZ01_LOCUS102359, partial [marine metagenome]
VGVGFWLSGLPRSGRLKTNNSSWPTPLVINRQVDVSIRPLADITNSSHPLEERFLIEDSLPIDG